MCTAVRIVRILPRCEDNSWHSYMAEDFLASAVALRYRSEAILKPEGLVVFDVSPWGVTTH